MEASDLFGRAGCDQPICATDMRAQSVLPDLTVGDLLGVIAWLLIKEKSIFLYCFQV